MSSTNDQTPEFPIPFSIGWPLSCTETLLEVEELRPDHKDSKAFEAWRTNQYFPIRNRLHTAIVQHLTHLAQTVGLKCPPNTDGLNLTWLKVWNNLAQTGSTSSPHDTSVLTRHFNMDLSMAIDQFRRPVENTDRVQFVHDQLNAWMENGPIMEVEAGECWNTGARLHIQFKKWVPTLGTNPKECNYDFTPLVPNQFSDPNIEHFTINAPSGELWINDWFRVPAFTDLCRELTKDLPSINNQAGALAQTRAYAQHLGFASFAVGNSCPSVVLQGNDLFIGRTIEQNDDWGEDGETPPISPPGTSLGSVCTDLWWTTIIDKSVLIDLVARTMSKEEAIKAVDEMAEEYDHTIMKAQVAPGTYHLYCAGNTDIFQKNCASPDIDWTAWSEPYGVLSSKELHFDALHGPLKDQTAPKPKAKKKKSVRA